VTEISLMRLQRRIFFFYTWRYSATTIALLNKPRLTTRPVDRVSHMQTAQKVITAYRRKRIIVCLLVALATLGATLAIRFISQRSVNEDYIRMAASQRVAALDNILRPLSAQRATLLPLVGKPCPDIHLTLRKMAASLQTVRSVALVTSGIVYCSSIFGPRQADLHRLQPALPAPRPLLLFSNDSSCSKAHRC
jgi:hypothetical protein